MANRLERLGQLARHRRRAVAEHLDTVNLPADRTIIEGILDRSEKSFAAEVPPAEREYLFVLEDLAQKRIIGTSMIYAQHGTKRAPHIFFRVENDERYSITLDRYFVHQTLRIGYNYNGPTEIGGLILLPEYRRNAHALGKALSYVRFLFIRMNRPIFRDQVLSELLPPLEVDGTSKLWEALGRHFTGLTYREADRISKDNKEFINALFPDDPIHTEISELARELAAEISAMSFRSENFVTIRRDVRRHLTSSPAGQRLDALVGALLGVDEDATVPVATIDLAFPTPTTTRLIRTTDTQSVTVAAVETFTHRIPPTDDRTMLVIQS